MDLSFRFDLWYSRLPKSPTERGSVHRCVVRPRDGERETPESIRITVDGGIEGDSWVRSKHKRPTNQVGIDILKQIRKQELTKRGSAMLLPVVVMTAYGDEKLTAEILVKNGANDYIPKPFGTGRDLEHKIEVAMAGDGALVPARNIVGSSVKIAFHPTDGEVRIETLTYRGAHHELLCVLKDQHLKDLQDLLLPEKFNGILGEALGAEMNISGKAARARVVKFRTMVKQDFRDQLGRAIGRNDIVENARTWKGYRLNPKVVRVVRWDQLIDDNE